MQATSPALFPNDEKAPYGGEKRNERKGRKETRRCPAKSVLEQVEQAPTIMSSAPDQAPAATNGTKRPASPAPDDSSSKVRLSELAPTTSTDDTPPAPLVEMGNTESKPTEPAPEAAAEPVAPVESSESTTQKERAPGVDPRQLDTLATLYSQNKLEGPEATTFEHVAALNDKVVLW